MFGGEMMVKSILDALGVDPEKMKAEFTGRVDQFEKNIETLNSAMISIDRRLKLIMEKLEISEVQNGQDAGIGNAPRLTGVKNSGSEHANKNA